MYAMLDAELKRLPEQYSSCQENRLSLDVEVLKALNPSVNEEETRGRRKEPYVDLSDALKNWIG